MRRCSFIIPTRDRPDELNRTLAMIRQYPTHLLGGIAPEVIVIDNASEIPATDAVTMGSSHEMSLEIIRVDENLGTAARNIGAEHATGEWIVMLDDDSAPIRGDFDRTLAELPHDVAALGGEILLPSGRHESGGLPEVIVGCGCVIRRDVFLEVGGYDASFGYYAEEYDLCAKLIAAGHRITHTRTIGFEHRKVAGGRDFGEILFRLVRNNAWVLARYAPRPTRDQAINAMLERYRGIAAKEGVPDAFERAFVVAQETIDMQPNLSLTESQWRRFTGAQAVERTLIPALRERGIDPVALIAQGKGSDIVEEELDRAGITIDDHAHERVIATLSPGPMLDAIEALGQHGSAWSPWSLDAGKAEMIGGD